MNTTPIIIEQGQVTIRTKTGEVWLTQNEIARLFGVFVAAVNSNIRSILKSETLREEKVSRLHSYDGGAVTLYNLEIITALAFRLKSREAEVYRQWLIRQAVNPPVIWQLPGNDATLN